MDYESLLLAWPDHISLNSYAPKSLSRIAALIRLNRLRTAECELLASLSLPPHDQVSADEHYALLALIRLQQGSLKACAELLQVLQRNNSSSWQYRWLQAQYWLQTGEAAHLKAVPCQYWSDEDEHPLLAIVHGSDRIDQRDFTTAEKILQRLMVRPTIEAYRLRAGLLVSQGRASEACALLQPIVKRAPELLLLHSQLLSHVITARLAPDVVPTARFAVEQHGEHPELLNNITSVKLHQRQPGYARRSALLLQTWASLGTHSPGLSNQICSYEQCGNAQWIEHLHPAIWRHPMVNTDLSGNLVLHLASIESPRYGNHLQTFVGALKARLPQEQLQLAMPASRALDLGPQQLRVAWISGDFTPHPVSRFLQHFFYASNEFRQHVHTFVSLGNHGPLSNLDTFRQLPGVSVLDVSAHYGSERYSAIRALEADVAIDLSGWTGGHYAEGFLARLAPVQVNYLGYFASSGLPTMDYWLGDEHLWPQQLKEYHTELIWRLPRPFLAWCPPSFLPEGQADVTPPPDGPIRFGSFNHNRKLSDRTLALWANILRLVPDSRLVLKASAGDDQPTQQLLARRMKRQGLDPERVDWLHLTATSSEHLQQYRHIDIALDPIPNGGCTTTCEALWMGCPVITLQGTHYVSRMSTSVLCAASLVDWVCASESDYLQLALNQSLNLNWLRQNRLFWRQAIVDSKLGDAVDLMKHLEHAFLQMHLGPA